MKNREIKHVFFDLDHTLWDFEKNSALTFHKIFELHNVPVETQQFLEVYEPINFEYWKLYREEKVTKEKLRYGRLRDAFAAVNFEASDTLIDSLSEDYINYLTTFNHLFEGTFDILDYLKPKYQLHIITNGFEEAQQRKMDNAEIAQYFKTVTNSEMAGVKKPNPFIFNYALEVADAQAEESIMIGDNLEADVHGAINAGYDAIYFNNRSEPSQDQIKEVNTLNEIKNYL
ncbi:MAG: noncanonical pyrimidine nucleotidase, YjjG family [Bacteroidetes bacterium MedPE-SWsnd-G2]|nr:MAG: noncanonical pyrimidine nucleotidase, YjjG family [Bacteroidetes bacterium MedPE-SWsnd-G2]